MAPGPVYELVKQTSLIARINYAKNHDTPFYIGITGCHPDESALYAVRIRAQGHEIDRQMKREGWGVTRIIHTKKIPKKDVTNQEVSLVQKYLHDPTGLCKNKYHGSTNGIRTLKGSVYVHFYTRIPRM